MCDVGHWHGAFLCYFDLLFVKVFLWFVGSLIQLCICLFTTLLQLGVCSFQNCILMCLSLLLLLLFSSDVDGFMFLKVMFNAFFLKSVVSFSKYLFIMLYT